MPLGRPWFMIEHVDPRAILGVSKDATNAQIQAAYRARARACHPDIRRDDPHAAAEFRRLTEAYEQLKLGGAVASREPVDLTIDQPPSSIKVPFAAAILGGEHQVTVRTTAKLDVQSCRVVIPAGIRDGERLKVGGAKVTVVVQSDPHLKRDGHDVVCEVPVTLSELILGATVTVPTVKGPKAIKFVRGSRPGLERRIAGCGVAGAGDQICRITVRWPDPNNDAIREVVERLARVETSPRPWDD